MSQRSEDVALAGQSLCELRPTYACVRQLECHVALYRAVRAHCLPNRAHATATDLANQSIGADRVAGAYGRGLRCRGRGVEELGQGAQKVARLDLSLLRQHLTQRGQQSRVPFLQCRDPGGAALRWQLEHLVQEP